MKRIALLNEIPENELRVIRSGSREFLVTRNGDTVTACGNVCPHHGAALSDGGLHDGVVTCPVHHARFDLSTGNAVSPPAFDGLTVYETDVIGEEVYIGKPVSGGFPEIIRSQSPSFVIIGGGAAGISCAETLRKHQFAGQVIVLSDENSFPYDRTALTTSYFAEGESRVLLRDPEYFTMSGIDIRLGERVHSVDRTSKAVICNSGLRIRYDKLLVATGSISRRLGIEGEHLPGVHLLRSLADAGGLREVIDQQKRLLVIGAGFLGIEVSLTAGALGVPVTVAAPDSLPLETAFGKGYAKRIAGMMKTAGVDWLPGKSVQAFSGVNALEAVNFADGSRIEIDAAVIAVGAAPPVPISGMEDLTGDSGIRVNTIFQTDDPDVYAAGDAADAHAGHWVTAMRQGMSAALSLLGEAVPPNETPFFWSDLGDETVRAVGNPGPRGTEAVIELGAIEDGDFLAVWRDGDKVTGGFSVGYDRELIDIEHSLRKNSR
jgi:apoptosis-inducing factor 3